MLTEEEALERLRRLVASATPPTLSNDETKALLYSAARADVAGAVRETEAWAASTPYVVGDTVVPTSRTGVRFIVTDAGTSDASEPDWTAAGTITDGGVEWEIDVELPAAWIPTYSLAAAAAEGWRMKAGLVSDRFRFADDGDSYDRDQVFAHCFRMAELYEKKAERGELVVGSPPSSGAGGIASIPLERSHRATLDADRLIDLQPWSGSGPLPRVN